MKRSKVGVGIGFVLNGDGIVCIDLDGCLVNGEVTATAAEIVDRCGPTFIEVSPSGDGLHVWGRARLGRGRRRPGVEVYGSGRYITVTGTRFNDSPAVLADISDVVAAL